MKQFYKTLHTILEAVNPLASDPNDPMASHDIEGWEIGDQLEAPDSYPIPVDPTQSSPLQSIRHAQYRDLLEADLLERDEYNRSAVIIFGLPGVGKSVGVAKVAKRLAKNFPTANDPHKMREFRNFNKLHATEQDIILKNPGDYFLLLDLRLAAIEVSDLMGLPVFDYVAMNNDPDENAKHYTVHTEIEGKSAYKGQKFEAKTEEELDILRTVKYKWAFLATHPDTAGYLFFDEFNQAPDEIIDAMYPFILDRIVFDSKLSPNISIVAAGNLKEHDPQSHNKPLPAALTRRFHGGVGTLVIDPDDWLKWARGETDDSPEIPLHPSLIAFVMSNKQKYFYQKPESGKYNDRLADPDSMTAFSKFLYRAEQKAGSGGIMDFRQLIRDFDQIARSSLGSKWAEVFIEFIKSSAITENVENIPAYMKWQYTATTTHAISSILYADPDLRKDESKGELKYLLSIFNKLPAELQKLITINLERHPNESIRGGYMAIKTKLPEIENAKESNGAINRVETGFKSYTSEFETFTDPQTSNVLQVGHEDILRSFEMAWDEKESFLIWGAPGRGKSWAVKKFAITKAREEGFPVPEDWHPGIPLSEANKFAAFNELHHQDKQKVFASPQEYFIYIPVNIAGMEAGEFMGLPRLFDQISRSNKPDWLRTVKYPWAWLATQPNIKGILFFDEINQAKPEVLKAMFMIVNTSDKMIFDRHISDDILIIGAGNLASQDIQAAKNRQPLPAALSRRFKTGSVVLTLTANVWIDWALKQTGDATIHPLLIQFLMSREESEKDRYIFGESLNPNAPNVTPDSLTTWSRLMWLYEKRWMPKLLNISATSTEGVDEIVHNILDQNKRADELQQFKDGWYLRARMVGPMPEFWARDFKTFVYHLKTIKWEELYELSKKFAPSEQLRKLGEEGQRIIDAMWVSVPYIVGRIGWIQRHDPFLKNAITKQRVTEIWEVYERLGAVQSATFFSYVKKLGSQEVLDKFLEMIFDSERLGLNIDPETAKRAQKAALDSVRFASKAKNLNIIQDKEDEEKDDGSI